MCPDVSRCINMLSYSLALFLSPFTPQHSLEVLHDYEQQASPVHTGE